MNSAFEWTLAVPNGLTQLDDFKLGGHGPQFVSAGQNPERIVARYYVGDPKGNIHGHVRFGDKAQGPPGFAHGGALASVLDELMGVAAWQQGLAVVAAELCLTYKKPTPLWTELVLEAWIEHRGERRVEIASKVALVDGTVCCKGRGTFVDIGEDAYRRFVKDAQNRKNQSVAP